MPRLYHTLLLLTLIACTLFASAQSNYWTHQYGARATLTGGVCMSCANDNSVFYYNPGAIGFIDSGSINITSQLYGLDFINLKNGAGPGVDMGNNKVNVTAQVLVGSISFKKAPRIKLVYGYIMRNSQRWDFNTQVDKMYDVIPQAPGLEHYRAKFDYTYTFFEYWGGIAAGYRINEHISVGLGHYGGYVGIRSNIYNSVSADAIDANGQAYTAAVNKRNEYRVDHMYILWKPGIDIHYGNWKIALAGMVPSTRLWGRGSIEKTIETYNMDRYNQDPENVLALYPSFAVSTDQRGLKTHFKLAPSIAVGAEYENKKFRLAFAFEYYFAVKEYEIIHGDVSNAYVRPANSLGNLSIDNYLTLHNGSYGVLNTGVGAEIKVSRRITILTGMHTDFNNKIPLFKKDVSAYVTETTPASWHYVDFALGMSINKANGKTYIGTTYNYGFSSYHQSFVNFAEPSYENNLAGPISNTMQSNVHQFSIVLGHTHYLNGLLIEKIKKMDRERKLRKRLRERRAK